MKCSVFLYSVLVIVLGFYVQESQSIFNRPCRPVTIRNGRVRQRSRGRNMRFTCNYGFQIVGQRFATCTRGNWDVPPPICVTTGCPYNPEFENGLVAPKLEGAILMFFCHSGYKLRGPSEIYCNGSTWNDTIPTCRATNESPPLSCDFEKRDLCLWEQDPMHDFDWKRHSLNTPSRSIGTGPSHDHTLGVGNNGYYLYVEATGEAENSTARIMSPLYSANLTEAGCFSFWYHMYGRNMGDLNIYFKAVGEANRTLMFTKSGNQGNRWQHGLFSLPRENTSFQIIMEGVRGQSFLSDIAVDDVAILQGNECETSLSATTEIIPTDDSDQIEIVNGMQSCRGKCNYNGTDDPNALCQCGWYCFDNYNCCPDFGFYCILGNDTVDTSDSAEMTTATMPKVASTIPDRFIIPINTKDDIDPYPTTGGRIPTTVAPTTTSTKTTTPTLRPTKPPTRKPPVPLNTTVSTSTRNPMIPNAPASVVKKVTLPGVIAIVVGAIVGIAGTGLIVYLVLQKRNNYKNGSGTAGFSDDSDVRFLTSDEILDFNIARPEDMEM